MGVHSIEFPCLIAVVLDEPLIARVFRLRRECWETVKVPALKGNAAEKNVSPAIPL
jgi:hypothetical protein